MIPKHLLDLFGAAHKRAVLVGNETCDVIVGLDLDGRHFLVDEVISRVNPDAIHGLSNHAGFLNPVRDGVWPAPEGTRLGYEYSTGDWEVPIGLIAGSRRGAKSKSHDPHPEAILHRTSILENLSLIRRHEAAKKTKRVEMEQYSQNPNL